MIMESFVRPPRYCELREDLGVWTLGILIRKGKYVSRAMEMFIRHAVASMENFSATFSRL